MTYAGSNGHVRFDLEKLGQGQLMTLMSKMTYISENASPRA